MIDWIVRNIIPIIIPIIQQIWNAVTTVVSIIVDIITHLINVISGIIDFIVGVFTGDWEKAWNGIKKIFSSAFDTLLKIPKTFIEYMINSFVNGIRLVVNTVKGIIDYLKTAFSTAFNSIKNVITYVMSAVKSVMSTTWNNIWATIKGIINRIINGIENMVNTIITGLNKIIEPLTKVGNKILETVGIKKFSFSTIGKVSLPRLAKGGIVNMPGRGVPVGAIAGERGKEGVIPLTDSQQMALLGEAIGKYITINANITNTMNGRIISRELQKVQNDNNFAFNR